MIRSETLVCEADDNTISNTPGRLVCDVHILDAVLGTREFDKLCEECESGDDVTIADGINGDDHTADDTVGDEQVIADDITVEGTVDSEKRIFTHKTP